MSSKILGSEFQMSVYKDHDYKLSEDLLNKIHVKLLGKFKGFDLWAVDEELIKDKVDINFTDGGNPGRYKYVPKSEIWVGSRMPYVAQLETASHEVKECILMVKHGLKYEEAHDKASITEEHLRQELSKSEINVDWQEDPRKLNITLEELSCLKNIIMARENLDCDIVEKIVRSVLGVGK